MALKDVLKALAGKKQVSDQDKKAQTALAILNSDHFPIVRAADTDMSRYKQIPLMGIAALGAAFSQIPTAARTIVQSVTTNIATGENLFVGINPKGVPGFLQSNQDGTVGNIMQYNDQGKKIIAGRMRFKPLENGLPVTSTTKTTMPFNPATMMVAVALIRIEQKLATLQKTAEEILQFLKLEKQAKQRGNLNTLAEILAEYKLNCNNERFCSLRNVEVQAIKREAQQDILFYQEQIARELGAQQVIHGVKNAQGLLDAVMDEFYEYQLACYLYSFASFLDVMLQKNFESGTLEAVAQQMNGHASRYAELYVDCRAQIANYQNTSIEAQILGGVGRAAKSLGQALASVPILREGPVDEALIKAGESLGKQNNDALLKKLEKFAPLEDNRMQPFIENVRMVDLLHNHPDSMLTDGESLYVLQPA